MRHALVHSMISAISNGNMMQNESYEWHLSIQYPSHYPVEGGWPRLEKGQYYMTNPETKFRCEAYDARPPMGSCCKTFAPGSVIGPVEEYDYTSKFASICVGNRWINVWRARSRGASWGTNFAYLCTSRECTWIQPSTISNDNASAGSSDEPYGSWVRHYRDVLKDDFFSSEGQLEMGRYRIDRASFEAIRNRG